MLLHALAIASLNAGVALMILPLIHRWDSQTEPGVDPLPEPPMPDPSTIGDLITVETTAATAQSSAAAAASAADAALSATNTQLTSADKDLSTALALLGIPVFVEPTPGDVSVYFSDASSRGFHVLKPLPISTPLPGVTPSPTPAPTPTPAPAPDAPPPS